MQIRIVFVGKNLVSAVFCTG